MYYGYDLNLDNDNLDNDYVGSSPILHLLPNKVIVIHHVLTVRSEADLQHLSIMGFVGEESRNRYFCDEANYCINDGKPFYISHINAI